jgi:hypothetical protein
MNHPLLDQVKASCPDLPDHLLHNLFTTAQCIYLSRSCNLARAKDFVAQVLGTPQAAKATPQANYMRLIRTMRDAVSAEFTDQVQRALHHFRLAMVSYFPAKAIRGAKELVLDGTSWSCRDSKVHLMTLALVIDGVAVPIASIDLAKKGHSSQAERAELLRRASKDYDLKGMTLLADREYVGPDWFTTLAEHEIKFVIRLKAGIYHDAVDGTKGKNWQQLCRKLRRCKNKEYVRKCITLFGQSFYYLIVRNPKAHLPQEDEFVFLLTSLKRAGRAPRLYRLRWQIEVTFGHLKLNGFDLEAMRVEGKPKRELLFQLVSLAFIWMSAEGLRFYRKNPRSRQMKWDGKRKVKTLVHSVFRQGMGWVMGKLAKPAAVLRRIASKIGRIDNIPWAHV